MNRNSFLTRFLLSPMASNKHYHPFKQKFKKAAVLIPLVERQNGLHVILTERALHLRHHPGQVSFPGGKYELLDKNLQQTAIRETQEEIGIEPHLIEIIGQLASLNTNSGFEVTPFVALIDNELELNIDHQEVKSVFEVPLHFLLDKRNIHKHRLVANKHRPFVYCIHYHNHWIWGATAHILKNLQMNLLQNKNHSHK
jgi:8-oxo-dGTP pyrophosphatase MutT (NUDIX family)